MAGGAFTAAGGRLRATSPYEGKVTGAVLRAARVAGPAGGNPRYRLSVPANTGYNYEVYGNPTLADLSWTALAFSLTETGAIDRNIFTATADGTLHLFVEARAARGFYTASFRVPGANTGTP